MRRVNIYNMNNLPDKFNQLLMDAIIDATDLLEIENELNDMYCQSIIRRCVSAFNHLPNNLQHEYFTGLYNHFVADGKYSTEHSNNPVFIYDAADNKPTPTAEYVDKLINRYKSEIANGYAPAAVLNMFDAAEIDILTRYYLT